MLRFGLSLREALRLDPEDAEIFSAAQELRELEERGHLHELVFSAVRAEKPQRLSLHIQRQIKSIYGIDPVAPEPELVAQTDAMIEEASRGRNRRRNAAKKGKLLVTRTRKPLPEKQNGQRTSDGPKARRRPV